jgi:hypothetical protein
MTSLADMVAKCLINAFLVFLTLVLAATRLGAAGDWPM